MDYRKFLGTTQTTVLPYTGGRWVHALDRRLRIKQRVDPGWWAFEISGRYATAKDAADPPPLDERPAVRGHLVGPWLFTKGTEATRLHIMPEEEPELLAPAVGRGWPGGDLLFDQLAFEEEAEDAARTALLAGQSIAELKGAAPSLRGAFGYARLLRAARSRGIEVSLREVAARLPALADGDLSTAALLDELEARVYQLDPASNHREVAAPPPPPPRPGTVDDADERAAEVLEHAGATFLSGRALGGRNYEIRFRYFGEHFVAVVDWETLHVYDSGICLEGHDEQLGLDSLPSVIAEAIGSDELYITRR